MLIPSAIPRAVAAFCCAILTGTGVPALGSLDLDGRAVKPLALPGTSITIDEGMATPVPPSTPRLSNTSIEFDYLRGLRNGSIEFEQLRRLRSSTIEFEQLRRLRNATIGFDLWAGRRVLELLPGSLDFGLRPTCSATTATLTITSIGYGDLTIDSITLEPPINEFSIVGDLTVPFTLASTESRDLVIQFAPSAPGPVSTTLKIVSDDEETGCVDQAPCDCDVETACFPVTITGEGDTIVAPIDPVDPEEPKPVAKNRYVSFKPNYAGLNVAVRVTFTDLPPPFEAFEGQSMWIGTTHDITEIPGETTPLPSPNFKAARLTCAGPVFMDWAEVGVLHVYSNAIVPGGEYTIESVPQDATANPACYSEMATSEGPWGDIVGTYDPDRCQTTETGHVDCWTPPQGFVDFDDITAVVDKFINYPGAPGKPRADIAPDKPDLIVDFNDIPMVVDAFRVLPYPYGGPKGCP